MDDYGEAEVFAINERKKFRLFFSKKAFVKEKNMNLICIVLANILDQDYCQNFLLLKIILKIRFIFSWSDRGFKIF